MTSTSARCSCSTAKALKAAASATRRQNYEYAGLYALRLAVSRQHPLTRVGEHLYGKAEQDARKSDQKQFDYVDPKNRAVQIEMEGAATEHLKQIGAWLKPRFKTANLDEGAFANEASVIIPVRNRVKTVGDAVDSVLKQKTSFPFNVIVVDNHSTDGTTDLLRSLAQATAGLSMSFPERQDLLIGGCWNRGDRAPGLRPVCSPARQRRHLQGRERPCRRSWMPSAARTARW